MPRTKLSKAELFEHFGNLLTSYDEQSQKRFTAIEDQASETKAELDRHKKDHETLKADFARLAETVGVAAKARPTTNDLAGDNADMFVTVLAIISLRFAYLP